MPTRSPEQLVQLRRLSTPTVYNGWERITAHDPAKDGFNIEEAVDFGSQLGPMVGYAATLVVDVSGSGGTGNQAWGDFRRYVAEQPGPKIVVVQDLDNPRVIGSIWGEVAANMFRSLGCVGTITDGGVRDINEMNSVGFKALARRLTVGHGRPLMVRYGSEVEVFGRKIAPGQLIHADHHGFLAVPPEDEQRLLDAATFLDAAEASLIHAGRNPSGAATELFLQNIDQAIARFSQTAKEHFRKPGEW